MEIHHVFDANDDVLGTEVLTARGRLLFRGFSVVALFAFGALTVLTAGVEEASATGWVEAAAVEQLAMVEWGVGLFDQADLELPPIDFVASPNREDCRGRAGMTSYDGPVTEIRLCGPLGPTSEWVMLHELGHAWTTNTVGPADRQAFIELRGLDAWRQGEWHERGAEHASEILVWGLMDRPVVPGHIDQNSCGELLAGYLVLVGNEPLHGFTDACTA